MKFCVSTEQLDAIGTDGCTKERSNNVIDIQAIARTKDTLHVCSFLSFILSLSPNIKL